LSLVVRETNLRGEYTGKINKEWLALHVKYLKLN
jgi:hypothetical protein